MKQNSKKTEALEKELNLQQLRVTRILNLTQAISNGASLNDLFRIYESFVSWELGIKKMMLFIKSTNGWKCCAHLGIPENSNLFDSPKLISELVKVNRLKNIDNDDRNQISEFDAVIPAQYKGKINLYTLIGDIDEKKGIYNVIQLLTTITNIIAQEIVRDRLFQEKQTIEEEIKDKKRKTKIAFIKLHGFNEFQNSILQYWSFFDEYVSRTKLIDLKLSVKKSSNGLEFEIQSDENISDTLLNEYFLEYADFLRVKDINPAANFELDILVDEITKLKKELEFQKFVFFQQMKFKPKLLGNNKFEVSKIMESPRIISSLKEKIKYYIEENNLNEAIIELYNFSRFEDIENDVIMIKSNLKKIQKLERLNLLDFNQTNIEYNKIKMSILSLI